MTKKVWLDASDYERIVPFTRGAGLYEVDRKTTYWHRNACGIVLGPRVTK